MYGPIVTDLHTAPERTFLTEDKHGRTRVQITVAASERLTLRALNLAVAGLLAELQGASVPDFDCTLTLEQTHTDCRITCARFPGVVTLKIEAWEDTALDGEAERWEACNPAAQSMLAPLAAVAWHILSEATAA